MERVPMTSAGEAALRKELEYLKTVERPRIVNAIAEARAQGDLRENAEYQYAKETQGFIEGRIVEVEGKLSNCQVIDITTIPETGKVMFGVTVHLYNINDDTEITYQIVGDDESDIKVNKLSIYSPIARALIGKEVGDEVRVETPGGVAEYEIQAVAHI